MKKKLYLAVLLLLLCNGLFAQNWKVTGNTGLTTSNFLGSLDNNPVIFRTNNIERGRIFGNGNWRLGSNINYAQFDNSGNLTFVGSSYYGVDANKYVFRFTGNLNYGLYFNQTSGRYEFRNGSGAPVFYLDYNNGNTTINGTLTIGTYTLPATDGASGQVLKTNGAGLLTWSNDNNDIYTAGTGIDITGNVITNTAPDQVVAIAAGTGIGVSGTYPNFTINNISPDRLVTLTGAGITTVTGTYPDFTIAATEADPKIQSALTHAVPKWNGTSLVDGIITDNGSFVGIGTANPTQKLDVMGTTRTMNFQMTSGAANGFVLSSDAGGNAAWVNPTSLVITETDPQVGIINHGSVPRWNGIALVDGRIFDDGNRVTIPDLRTSAFQLEGTTSNGYVLRSDAAGNAAWTSLVALETDPKVGSLAAGRVPRWFGTSLVNGSIYDDGNSIGIGTVSPGAKLDIAGNLKAANIQLTGGAANGFVLRSDAAGNAAWVNSTSLAITETDPQVAAVNIGKVPRWNGTALVDGSINDDGISVTTNNLITAGLRLPNGASNGFVLRSDATGNATWVNSTSLAITETDPQVAAVSIGKVPRWNGTALVDGSINDDGISVTTNNLITAALRIPNGASNGFVLRSDASGNAAWVNSTSLAITETDPQVGIINHGSVPRWNGTALVDGRIFDDGNRVTIPDLRTSAFQLEGTTSNGYVLRSDAAGNAAWTSLVALETDPKVGSLAAGRVPRWFGTSLVNGSIYDDGNSIGIGTVSPGAKLDIAGNLKAANIQLTGGAANGFVLRSDAAGNAAWVNSTSLAISETDPQVAAVSIGKVPRWNGTALVDGSINDDGSNVEITNLRVNTFQMTNGASDGYFLKSDASGNAIWASNPAGWSLTGNSGIVPGTNFIGTTDNQPLQFRVNNQPAGLLNISHSNTAFGYQSLLSNGSGTMNTAQGFQALLSNTTGFNNTASGYQSLYSNTTGLDNTAFGYNALRANTTSFHNTAIGSRAMPANTTGYDNTAIGFQALYFNTTGIYNTAGGVSALYSNTTANYNTAIGFQAGLSNSTGNANSAFGHQALYNNTAAGNTAIGYQASYSNTTGVENAALGYLALYANNTGHRNAGVGGYALNSNTTGFYNVAMGHQALKLNTEGNSNTALGAASMQYNILGKSNTATGHVSLYYNQNGNNNTANGYRTLENSQGNNNSAFGDSALYTNTTGNNNTGIGHRANVSSGALNNATAIGANAYVGASNSLVLGSIGGVNNATDTVNVGIGITTPEERLHVAGKIKTTSFQMTDGALPGYILASDADGNASWVNSTVIPITEADPKVGTLALNNMPKWDGSKLVDGNIFDDGTNVGIGTITPSAILEVSGGDAIINGITVGKGSGDVKAKENTAVGGRALSLNISGYANTAYGFQALYSNTTGKYNTANGWNTLYFNTIGNGNTANGINTLYYNTTGSDNTAIGNGALYYNTIGCNNTANGYGALFNNTTGYSNVAVGTSALNSNTEGNNLVAIGDSALFNNTGLGNTAVGSKTLFSNDIGFGNTAIGEGALFSQTQGYRNTALGYYTLNHNINGYGHTASGVYALFNNTTGMENTANGYFALYSNSSGSGNTAYGTGALYSNINGNSNTCVGISADVSSPDFSNTTTIGAYSRASASNQVRIGNSFVTSIGGYADWTNISDGRIKMNIKENVPGLAFINKLKPVTYNLNLDASDKIIQMPQLKDSDGKIINHSTQQDLEARKAKEQIVYTGFVAQDVEKAAKSINYNFSGVDAAKNEKDLYGLRYAEFVVPLVKAVQELSTQNDSLQSINKNQQQQINNLQSRLDKIEQLVKYIQECNPCNETPGNSTVEQFSTKIGDEVSLGQNIPNPFSNTTVINYTLPQKFTVAKMVITDKYGKTIKQVTISGTGKGMLTVDASTLSNGAYQYSLWIEGRLVATKQMVLAR